MHDVGSPVTHSDSGGICPSHEFSPRSGNKYCTYYRNNQGDAIWRLLNSTWPVGEGMMTAPRKRFAGRFLSPPSFKS